MAARNSWAVQNSGPTGLITVEDARVALGALVAPGASGIVARSGFRPGAGATPGLVTASGTPDAFVHVAPFQLFYQTTRATVGGPYMLTLDAQFNVNILSTPADPTNPRNDLVIAQQSDTFYGDGNSLWTIRQVVGTPSGSPVDPTVTGSTDYVTLARVRVNANATTITGANITDLRSSGHAKSLTGGLYTTALGGLLPVANTTERGGLTPHLGQQIWRVDTGWTEVYDGTNWQFQGPWRARQTLSASAGSVTFSGIPSGLRDLRISYTARSDNATNVMFLLLQVNGDSAAHYNAEWVTGANTTVAANNNGGTTSATCGMLTAASAPAGVYGNGVIDFVGWDSPHSTFLGFTHTGVALGTGVANFWTISGGGHFFQAGPYTSVTLLPQAGNFVAGSSFDLLGWAS